MESSDKRYSSGRGWRVSTPAFPGCASMDRFYEEAHRLLEARFTELRESGERGVFVADYIIHRDKSADEITLRLRRRLNGRYEDERIFCHRWADGAVVPRRAHSPLNSLLCYIISKKPRRDKSKSKTDE